MSDTNTETGKENETPEVFKDSLVKKGGKRGLFKKESWKQRYFVLEDGTLKYFKSQEQYDKGKKPIKGNLIELKDYVFMPQGDPISFSLLPHTHQGEKSRRWDFRAKDRLHRQQWKEQLLAHGCLTQDEIENMNARAVEEERNKEAQSAAAAAVSEATKATEDSVAQGEGSTSTTEQAKEEEKKADTEAAATGEETNATEEKSKPAEQAESKPADASDAKAEEEKTESIDNAEGAASTKEGTDAKDEDTPTPAPAAAAKDEAPEASTKPEEQKHPEEPTPDSSVDPSPAVQEEGKDEATTAAVTSDKGPQEAKEEGAAPEEVSREMAEQLFKEFDKDNSGTIDENELADLWFEVKGELMSTDALKSLMKAVDTDSSGQIDFDEFWALLSQNSPAGESKLFKDLAFLKAKLVARALKRRVKKVRKELKNTTIEKGTESISKSFKVTLGPEECSSGLSIALEYIKETNDLSAFGGEEGASTVLVATIDCQAGASEEAVQTAVGFLEGLSSSVPFPLKAEHVAGEQPSIKLTCLIPQNFEMYLSQIVPGGDISNFLQKLSVALALSKTIPGLFTGTEPNHLQRLSMEVRGSISLDNSVPSVLRTVSEALGNPMIAAVGDQLTEGPAEYTQAMPEMEVWPLLLEQLKQKRALPQIEVAERLGKLSGEQLLKLAKSALATALESNASSAEVYEIFQPVLQGVSSVKVHTNSFTVAINITGLDVKPLLLPQEELKAAGSIEDVAKEIGLVEEE